MFLYYCRVVSGGAVAVDGRKLVDYSGMSLFTANNALIVTTEDYLRIDSLYVDGIYDNLADRNSDQTRTTDDIGKLYQLGNDGSVWQLTDVVPASDGPPPVAYETTWTEYEYTVPAL